MFFIKITKPHTGTILVLKSICIFLSHIQWSFLHKIFKENSTTVVLCISFAEKATFTIKSAFNSAYLMWHIVISIDADNTYIYCADILWKDRLLSKIAGTCTPFFSSHLSLLPSITGQSCQQGCNLDKSIGEMEGEWRICFDAVQPPANGVQQQNKIKCFSFRKSGQSNGEEKKYNSTA